MGARWNNLPERTHSDGSCTRLDLDNAEAHPLAAEWASPQGPGVGKGKETTRQRVRHQCAPCDPIASPSRSTGRAQGQPSKVLVLLRSWSIGGRPYQSLTGLDVQAEHRLYGEGQPWRGR